MNANQVRHLVSASEGANLMEAKVQEVRHDTVEIPSMGPMRTTPVSAADYLPYSYMETRKVFLRNRHQVRGQTIKAAYDYQSHTIFFRRVRG